MGLCMKGLESTLTSATVCVQVPDDHAYIRLANTLKWGKMTDLIVDDLKRSTAKLQWWVGRKLQIRIHLAIYVLQSLVKMTDRAMEEAIRGNGIYQVFCGKTIIENWHCPDHTKIEDFRNRISPPTQQKLVSYVLQVATDMGFANPSRMDVDSTVQEAGMAYPSDAHLLTKLAYKCKKVIAYIAGKLGVPASADVDVKSVKKRAKGYFFLSKNKSKEIKHKAFRDLYDIVKQEVMPTVHECMNLSVEQMQSLPWNIRRALEQIRNHAQKYLVDVAHFIKTHTLKTGKILSFHLLDVACISKGKVGKEREFGRVYQLGRIGGNFLMILPATSVRQEDKPSLIPMLKEHQAIFGEGVLKSMGTDKGYFTKANTEEALKIVKEVGIQIPGNVKLKRPISQALKDRRAGIEPLIGHAKRFGLAKSKAKSDITTLASGYRSVLGFDLHQMTRYLSGKVKMAIIK
jgi:IS5 family transposase